MKAVSSFSVNPVDYLVYLTNQGVFKREKKCEIEASGQWVLGTLILCESHENKNKNQNTGCRYFQWEWNVCPLKSSCEPNFSLEETALRMRVRGGGRVGGSTDSAYFAHFFRWCFSSPSSSRGIPHPAFKIAQPVLRSAEPSPQSLQLSILCHSVFSESSGGMGKRWPLKEKGQAERFVTGWLCSYS